MKKSAYRNYHSQNCRLVQKDIKSFPEIKCMDYVDIFPRSEENRVALNDEAIKLGNIIEKTKEEQHIV